MPWQDRWRRLVVRRLPLSLGALVSYLGTLGHFYCVCVITGRRLCYGPGVENGSSRNLRREGDAARSVFVLLLAHGQSTISRRPLLVIFFVFSQPSLTVVTRS